MAMFENISEFFKRFMQNDKKELLAENPPSQSKETAKDRLHVVLMQDRANVSADYIDLMRQDIIDDIKKYIDIDEKEIDLKLTNQIKNDGTNGFPALYANIPINRIKNDKKANDIDKDVRENASEYKELKKTIVNIAEKRSKAVKKEKNEATEVTKVVKKAENTKAATDKKTTSTKKKSTTKSVDKDESKKKAEQKSEEATESKAKTKVVKKESTNNK